MKTFVCKLASRSTLIFTSSMFFLLCLLSNTLFQSDFTYLTQTFHYSSQYAYELLHTIEHTGRLHHLLILLPDLIMTLLYSALLVGLQYRLSQKLTHNCHIITFLTFIPLLLTFVQLSEIITLAVLIRDYSHTHNNLAHLASCLTTIKFYLTPIVFLLPILLYGVNITLKRFHKDGTNES